MSLPQYRSHGSASEVAPKKQQDSANVRSSGTSSKVPAVSKGVPVGDFKRPAISRGILNQSARSLATTTVTEVRKG